MRRIAVAPSNFARRAAASTGGSSRPRAGSASSSASVGMGRRSRGSLTARLRARPADRSPQALGEALLACASGIMLAFGPKRGPETHVQLLGLALHEVRETGRGGAPDLSGSE